MKTKCPSCGATNSLDTLIAFDDARDVLTLVLSLDSVLARYLVRYIALFRPAQKDLSWSRTANLLNALLPDIKSGKISRNGNVYSAPSEAWLWAIEQVLAVRHNLTLPLKGHGYLYEVLSRWDSQKLTEVLTHDAVVTSKVQKSKSFEGMDNLGELTGWIPDGL